MSDVDLSVYTMFHCPWLLIISLREVTNTAAEVLCLMMLDWDWDKPMEKDGTFQELWITFLKSCWFCRWICLKTTTISETNMCFVKTKHDHPVLTPTSSTHWCSQDAKTFDHRLFICDIQVSMDGVKHICELYNFRLGFSTYLLLKAVWRARR